MRKFNLKEANEGKDVCTRKMEAVKIRSFHAGNDLWCINARIQRNDGSYAIKDYLPNGRLYLMDFEHEDDLMMKE